jgi:PAS domain S-box-containing protein
MLETDGKERFINDRFRTTPPLPLIPLTSGCGSTTMPVSCASSLSSAESSAESSDGQFDSSDNDVTIAKPFSALPFNASHVGSQLWHTTASAIIVEPARNILSGEPLHKLQHESTIEWTYSLPVPIVVLDPSDDLHNINANSAAVLSNSHEHRAFITWNSAMAKLSGCTRTPFDSFLSRKSFLKSEVQSRQFGLSRQPTSEGLFRFLNFFLDFCRDTIIETYWLVISGNETIQKTCKASLHHLDGTTRSVSIRMVRQDLSLTVSQLDSGSTIPSCSQPFYIVCFIDDECDTRVSPSSSVVNPGLATNTLKTLGTDSGNVSSASVNGSIFQARELRQLFETANAAMFGIDENGLINEWNEKTAEVFGYTALEALHKPFVETFVPLKQQETIREVLDMALQGHGTSGCELEIWTKYEDVRFLTLNTSVRRNVSSDGSTGETIIGVLVVAHDVTEAAKHERGVAAMASELRQLIDTANAPIFGIDCDG